MYNAFLVCFRKDFILAGFLVVGDKLSLVYFDYQMAMATASGSGGQKNNSREGTAIIYVINSPYVRPLRVLHHSLLENSSLAECDVVIITDDPLVADDPFIKKIATKIELITHLQLDDFAHIRGDRIDAKLATSFAPKYTFLKLLMFNERGYRRHIFIDADMLCVNTVDEALLCQDVDVKAVFEYGKHTFPSPREALEIPSYSRSDSLDYIRRHSGHRVQPIAPINSGFLVLQGKGISDTHFEKALRLASTKAFPNEQSLTMEIIRSQGLSFMRLPIWYNCRRRVFSSLGESYFEEVSSQVKLLHYTPGKPWKMRDSELRNYDKIWHQYESTLAA